MRIKEHNKRSEIKEGINKGIIAGFLSSLCCVGPLIIVLLGLGSVSFALSMGQYRPYFLGLGILFVVLTIWLYLNKKNKSCDTNCLSLEGIKKEKIFILSVISSMVVIYIIALYAVVPALSPPVYRYAVSKESKEHTPPTVIDNSPVKRESSLNRLYIRIDKMSCSGCASGIQNILQSLDGIIDAKISYTDGTGEIDYDPDEITAEEIMDNKVFLTYPSVIISDQRIR